MTLPNRKKPRLAAYDYSTPGAYFITLCTKNRRKILSSLDVGTGVLDGPQTRLLEYGKIADKYIRQMDAHYEKISVDKYVIMPDHIHLLIRILSGTAGGPSGTPVPTANSSIPRFVSTLKRFCNKEYGEDIWQAHYYDHIVRSEADYREIWAYIEENPLRWKQKGRFDPK